MKYHDAILDLIGVAPTKSPKRLAVIQEREKACGVQFPPSVRDWFALADADSLFQGHTSPDFLTPLNDLGEVTETEQGYLRVARENQNVVAWYVRLDQGDDPPVYDNNDQFSEDLSAVKWNLNAASFSGFLFNSMAAGRFGGWLPGWYLEADEPLPDAATRKTLAERFRPGPATENSAVKVYRFYDPHGVVIIANNSDANGVAKWRILAESEEWLYDFARRVWDLGTLSGTLEAEIGHPDAIGPRVLRRLQDEWDGANRSI